MRNLWVAAVTMGVIVTAMVACEDDSDSMEPYDSAIGVPVMPDGSVPDTASATRAACLDRPNVLPRPPEGRLPCELIPPGLVLSR